VGSITQSKRPLKRRISNFKTLNRRDTKRGDTLKKEGLFKSPIIKNRRRKGDEEESCFVGGVKGDVGGVGVDPPPPRGFYENFDENDDEKNSVVVVVVVVVVLFFFFFFFFFFSVVVVIKVFVAKNEKRSRRRIGNPSATHAIKGEVILAGEKLRGGTHRPRV